MAFKITKQRITDDDFVLETTIREYYPKIYRYLYHRLLNEALAKDLTQETFYRFFAHIEDYHEDGKLLNYLYRIAQRILYDHTKAQKAPLQEWDENKMHDNTYNGHVVYQQKEEILILRRWVNELPTKLQEIVYYRFDEKMKFKEISKITGINVSTVKSQLKLAIEMLAKKAKEEE